ELDCYDAVRSGVAALIRLLDDSDPVGRRAAAYALAWFPEDAAGTIHVLEVLLRSESNEIDIATVLLSGGWLARTSDTSLRGSSCTDFLTHESFVVRVGVAIALAVDPIDESGLNVLLEALESQARLDDFRDELQLNEGDLVGYAGLQLSAAGATKRAVSVPA